MTDSPAVPLRLLRLAQISTAYMILVILWGAWVRITGSGAGCGSHWPSCNGELLPLDPSLETFIEYSHRLSSGITLPLILWLGIWCARSLGLSHSSTRAAMLTMLFLLIESLVGAGLVKFELVAGNTSVRRAIVASVHLINTHFLVAAAALCAESLKDPSRTLRDLLLPTNFPRKLLALGLFGLLIISTAGAITALGDTLFPAATHREVIDQMQEGFAQGEHFLVRLRIIHPIVAVMVSMYWFVLWQFITLVIPSQKTLRWTLALIGIQLCAGLLNVALSAPGWMQILHLFLGMLVWLGAIKTYMLQNESL